MQRYSLSFLLVIAAFLLQTVVVPHIRVFGVQPDLILVVVICLALSEGQLFGATFGFAGGFLEDLLMAEHMGFNMLAKTIIASLAGLLKDYGRPGGAVLPVATVLMASVLSQVILALLAFLFGEINIFNAIFNWLIIPTAIYNALFTPFIYPVVSRLVKWQESVELVP